MIKIALTNLRLYNEGELVFEWVDLPQDDLSSVFDRIGHDEYFISDYECEMFHIEIDEYEGLEQLNNLAKELDELDSYELKVLEAIIESEHCSDISEALDLLREENYIFHEACDLLELAETFIEEGIFGEIPNSIKGYIDYEKIADDLRLDGYIETSMGVITYD